MAGAARTRTASSSSSPRPRERRRATRSSACAPASCTRSASSIACCSRARIPTRPTAPGARTRSSWRSTAAQAGGTCFCVSMGTGPKADSRLRPRADRGARGRPPLLRGRGRQRARRRACCASVPHAAAGAASEQAAASAVVERTAAQMGRELETDGHQGAALPQLRAPALGRGRRALPDLRQLHDGLPDLLLHDRRGRHRPRRRARRALAALGLVLHDGLLAHPRRRACAPRRARATASG